MSKLREIDAIVFDAYGTLLDIASIDELLKSHFGEKAKPLAATWRRKQLEYSWLRGLMKKYINFYALTEDALEYASKLHGIQLAATAKQELMRAYLKLSVYPEVAEVLEQLAGEYKLAILSNANPELLDSAVGYNKVKKYLDAIFSVEQIKTYKPEPEVYQIAVDGLNIPAGKIAFISSNPWDVAGAGYFGFKVIWVNRKGTINEELGIDPDFEIDDLSGLLLL